jgi:hypothetical protein
MPPRRGWGIFGLGFYKDVAPTAGLRKLDKKSGQQIFNDYAVIILFLIGPKIFVENHTLPKHFNL